MSKKKHEADRMEPFWWGLFAGGGTIAAMVVPIHIIIFGIAGPLGWLPEGVATDDHIRGLLGNPIVVVYLLAFISLPLFHWAHRFRFTVHDLGFHQAPAGVAVLFYGVAVLGSIGAFLVLVAVPATEWIADLLQG